jgi:hypothetical protein
LEIANVPVVANPERNLVDLFANRLFMAWIEDSEWLDIDTNHGTPERNLLHKYKGMNFRDSNNDLQVVTSVEWKGGRSRIGWTLVCVNQSDGEEMPWQIHDVIDLIAVCVQPPDLHVEIVVNEPKRADNILKKEAVDAEKKAKADEKKQQATERRLAREQKRINIV